MTILSVNDGCRERETDNYEKAEVVENRVITSDEERAEVSRLLARSFKDAPFNRYVFQDLSPDRNWLQTLEWMYDKRLRLGELSGGRVYGRFSNGQLVSTLTIAPVESHDPTYNAIIHSCLLLWPQYAGIDSFKRFLQVGKLFTEKGEEFNGCVPNHLMMVATDDNYRGQGHVKELMKFAFSHISGDICLDTQCTANVRLYEKLGFKLTGEWVMLPGTEWEFRNYNMKATAISLPSC